MGLEFDVVAIGAGSAGCAVVAGLAEVDLGTVCVLEPGPNDAVPQVRIQGSAFAVADGMQLGVHAALGAADQASKPPFFTPMLVAVRWSLR